MNKFIKAIMAGLSISLAGLIYLSLDNQIIGAILFSIGLFTIYTFGFNLYTGKVCYIPYHKPIYLIEIFIVLLGNIAGTVSMGYLFRYTKQSKLIDKVSYIVEGKLSDTMISTFIMSILCGIMMCIAVMGYLNIKDSIGRYFALIIPIMVFILSGYEHSIANLFYFSFANQWNWKTVIYMIIMLLGNMIGGLIIPLVLYKLDGKEIGSD